ncbi:MAG: hypothetical protein JXA13_09310 [Anaerolineales bacterium]|nr:hypothetical protein [Anaerolineales bacterium]
MASKTCRKTTCQGCEIQGKLLCVHTGPKLLDFWALFFSHGIHLITGMVIGEHWTGPVIWLVLAVVFFVYFETLILCRHYPHYMEDGFMLNRHANAGLPKIPAFDPQPLTRLEKAAWLG